MQTTSVRLDDLAPDPNNRRLHGERSVAAIARSLERFGQRRPVVARRLPSGGLQLEAGHGVVAAARALGWATVDALLVDDDDANARAFSVADNRTAELSEWDLAALATDVWPVNDDLVRALHVDELLGVGLVGEPTWLAPPVEPAVASEPEHAAPAAREPLPDGSVWRVGPHRVAVGSALCDDTMRRALGGLRPDFVVVDPPFEMPVRVWRRFVRDPCLVFGTAKVLYAVPERLFRFERVLIKSQRHAHRSCSTQVVSEHVVVAQVGSRRALPADRRASMRSVVRIEEYAESAFPHAKPPRLIAEHLDHYTERVGVVLDPFMGSGSTLVACARTGRVGVGVEIDGARAAEAVSWLETEAKATACREK